MAASRAYGSGFSCPGETKQLPERNRCKGSIRRPGVDRQRCLRLKRTIYQRRLAIWLPYAISSSGFPKERCLVFWDQTVRANPPPSECSPEFCRRPAEKSLLADVQLLTRPLKLRKESVFCLRTLRSLSH